jgi:hypothetical protein
VKETGKGRAGNTGGGEKSVHRFSCLLFLLLNQIYYYKNVTFLRCSLFLKNS